MLVGAAPAPVQNKLVACAMAGFVVEATPPRERESGDYLIVWPSLDHRTFGNDA